MTVDAARALADEARAERFPDHGLQSQARWSAASRSWAFLVDLRMDAPVILVTEHGEVSWLFGPGVSRVLETFAVE